MIRKKSTCFIAIIIAFLIITAYAGGLFPDTDVMFGTSMPSVGLAIGRNADEIAETDAGIQEKYLNFSNEDYITFGQYLAGIKAKVNDYKVANNTLTATISVRKATMELSFNWAEQIGIAIYPTGTRVETEKEAANPGTNILPPIGGTLPSPQFAIKRKADEQEVNENGLTQTWALFTDEDYTAFSAYLAETGAILLNSSIEVGIVNAEIGLNGFSFRFIYNWNAQTASVIYPEGTMPETSRWNAPVGKGSILPEVKELGKELPRMSVAIEREPSSEETLPDGSLRETYLDFSEADYNTFSQYLQKAGCSLEEYHTDENGMLVINLTNGSGKLTFSYDAVRHTGIVTYPGQTRVEKAWVPSPVSTPVPTSTPKPSTHYSKDQCWDIAYNYFKNLRWKDPQSVKVYEHTVAYSKGEYIFTIDYSAANGFGGVNRGYYWITVNASTGKVTLAFNDE